MSDDEVCNYPWDTWSNLTSDNNWWSIFKQYGQLSD